MTWLSSSYAKQRFTTLGLTFTTILALVFASFPVLVTPAAAQAQLAPAGAGTYDDTDPHFTYTGTWSTGSGIQDAYKKTLHYTNDGSATASFTFNGTGFVLYRVTYANRGIMKISIDGNFYQNIDNNSPTAAWRVPLTVSGLKQQTPGSNVHTVEFANTPGKFMDIDALIVLNGTNAPKVNPITKNASAPPSAAPSVRPNIRANIAPAAPKPFLPNSTPKALAFTGTDASPGTFIGTVNPPTDTTPVKLTDPAFNAPSGALNPVWSPDGTQIAFNDSTGALQILTVATGAVAPALLPNGTTIDAETPIAWDPNTATLGKRIAFVDNTNSELELLDFTNIASSTLTTLTDGTGNANPGAVSWTKTGGTQGTITFSNQTATQTVIDNITPTAACLTTPPCTPTQAVADTPAANGIFQVAPAWSPDGTLLAYIEGGLASQTAGNSDIYVYNPATSISTPITTATNDSGATGFKMTLTWSPNMGTAGAPTFSLAYVQPNSSGTLPAIKLVSGIAVSTLTTATYTPSVDYTAPASGTITSVSWTSTPVAVSLTNVPGTATVVAGNSESFTITATNTTAADISGVTIIDTIPTGWTGITVTAPTANITTPVPVLGQVVTATVPTLAAGATASFVVTATVPVDAPAATVTSPATVMYGTITSEADASVVVTPAITFTNVANPTTAIAGSSVTFTLTATNNSTVPVPTVSIKDTIPANWVITTVVSSANVVPTASATGQLVTGDVASLAVGAIATVTITATVPLNAAAGTVMNPATVTYGGNRTLTATSNVTLNSGAVIDEYRDADKQHCGNRAKRNIHIDGDKQQQRFYHERKSKRYRSVTYYQYRGDICCGWITRYGTHGQRPDCYCEHWYTYRRRSRNYHHHRDGSRQRYARDADEFGDSEL